MIDPKKRPMGNVVVALLPGVAEPLTPDNYLLKTRDYVDQIQTMAKKHLPNYEPFLISLDLIKDEKWVKDTYNLLMESSTIEYSTLNRNGVKFLMVVDNEIVERGMVFDYSLAHFVWTAMSQEFHKETCNCLDPDPAVDAKTSDGGELIFRPTGPKDPQFPFGLNG